MSGKLPLNIIFSTNVVVLCNIKKISQTELHELTGISRSSLSTIMKGNSTMIQFDTIEKIAEALRVNPNELFIDRGFEGDNNER